MITFKEINNKNDMLPYLNWKVIADKNSLNGNFLNEKGEIVSSQHKGRIYNLRAKVEKERGLIARIVRLLVGITLSLAILPLFSERVRDLFSNKEVVVLRQLVRDEQVHTHVHGKKIAKINSFEMENCKPNCMHTCTVYTSKIENNGMIAETGEEFELDGIEIKDILEHLPKGVIKGNIDHFVNQDYPKI